METDNRFFFVEQKLETGGKSFFYKLTLFGVVILALSLVLFATVLRQYYFQLFPLLFLLVFAVSATSYRRLIKAGESNMLRFSSAYMQMTLIKFVVYLSFMLVCLFTKSIGNVVAFVISFFVLYLLFTIFEVKQVLSFYKGNKS